MPLIKGDDFKPHGMFKNGHFNTFVPYVFGTVPDVSYSRIRLDTPDNDFLDIDFSRRGSKRLVILCHGLEGSSKSGYVLLFADYFNKNKWDVVAMNYRGCSGETNRKLQMYNSGSTGDLDLVVHHVLPHYEEIILVGFSLGGNIVLKYLGEEIFDISPKIKTAIAISAPVNLADASQALLKWENIFYQWKFLVSLSMKIWKKKKQYPNEINRRLLLRSTNLYKFDNNFTAPIFGYRDADDYYAQNQAIQWLQNIHVPALIINAKDDPFLGPECYPYELIKELDNVNLCAPEYGGHVGFAYSRNDRSWLFEKISGFINN